MITLFSLILGLLIGYYGRQVYDKLNTLVDHYQDTREAKQVGVVRAQGTLATRNQPIDLSSDTGPIMRPTPQTIEDQRQEDRATALRENHR